MLVEMASHRHLSMRGEVLILRTMASTDRSGHRQVALASDSGSSLAPLPMRRCSTDGRTEWCQGSTSTVIPSVVMEAHAKAENSPQSGPRLWIRFRESAEPISISANAHRITWGRECLLMGDERKVGRANADQGACVAPATVTASAMNMEGRYQEPPAGEYPASLHYFDGFACGVKAQREEWRNGL